MDLSKGSHIKPIYCFSVINWLSEALDTVPHDISISRESGYMESSQLAAKELTAG